MKKILILCFSLLCVTFWNADAQGVRFREGSFEEVRKEAKSQNKLIFIDFYTSWCGPCKTLVRQVFPLPEVGEFFNKNFVSCKLDAEREGKELAKKYEIMAYPTLLFLDTEGNVINRSVGFMSADLLIQAGEKAIASVNGRDNVTNLKKRYAEGHRDEQFLRQYIGKMMEFKDFPFEAFDEYLKVQTSMQEDSPEMMEFLLEHERCFMLGGEAERIFLTNQDAYMKLADKKLRMTLGAFYVRMLKQTEKVALRTRDVRQYELFVDRWKKLPDKQYGQNDQALELKLLLLKGEEDTYRELAVRYLDSLMDANSVEKIQAFDRMRSERLVKDERASDDTLKKASSGVQALRQVNLMWEVERDLMRIATGKELKCFPKWIAYGKELLPESYQMMDLEAGLLYRQGKREEGIELKRKALGLISPRNKMASHVEEELKGMEEGTY